MPVTTRLKIDNRDGVPEVLPEDLKPHLAEVTLIDVRRPNEFNDELSHIPGAKLVTMGPDIEAFLKTRSKDEEIVFICRSGGRSGAVTQASRAMGFTRTINLRGGMLLWNEKKFPVEK